MMQIDTWPWSVPHLLGHTALIGPQVCKRVKFYIIRLSYKLPWHDLWLSFVTFDLLNMWRSYIISINQVWFQSDFQLFKWVEFLYSEPSHDLTSGPLMTFFFLPWYMNFDMNIQRVPQCINNPSLVPIRLYSNEVTFHTFSHLSPWPWWPLTKSTYKDFHVASTT